MHKNYSVMKNCKYIFSVGIHFFQYARRFGSWLYSGMQVTGVIPTNFVLRICLW